MAYAKNDPKTWNDKIFVNPEVASWYIKFIDFWKGIAEEYNSDDILQHAFVFCIK